MKRTLSLVLGIITALSLPMATNAASPNTEAKVVNSSLTAVMPRKAYENKIRTISGKSSWTSSSYYCVAGDYFGGGIEDRVNLTGKIQFSTSSSGPWTTLSTKSLNYSAITLEVNKTGFYRFVLSNTSSSSVTAECYVMVN